ncbi:MAG: hypothetical protein ACRC6V_03230 [Bacteroidales bacterium]
MSTEVIINYAGRYSIDFTTGNRDLGQYVGCTPNGPGLYFNGSDVLSMMERSVFIDSMPEAVQAMSKLLVADAIFNSYHYAYMIQSQMANPACQEDAEHRTLQFFLDIEDDQFKDEFEKQLYHILTVDVRLIR